MQWRPRSALSWRVSVGARRPCGRAACGSNYGWCPGGERPGGSRAWRRSPGGSLADKRGSGCSCRRSDAKVLQGNYERFMQRKQSGLRLQRANVVARLHDVIGCVDLVTSMGTLSEERSGKNLPPSTGPPRHTKMQDDKMQITFKSTLDLLLSKVSLTYGNPRSNAKGEMGPTSCLPPPCDAP